MIFKQNHIIQLGILFFFFLFSGVNGYSLFFPPEEKGECAETKSLSLTDRYTDKSVLSSGKWVKISVEETGIHKIPYSELTKMGFSNPSAVRVFGYGGEMLPVANDVFRPDDLPETAIWHHNNAIYFYAQNVVIWKWNESRQMFLQDLHRYSNIAYYFLTNLQGNIKSIENQTPETEVANVTVTHFDDLRFHEAELRKLGTSGAHYFGEDFSNGTTRTFSFTFPLRDISLPVKVFSRVAALGERRSHFFFKIKNQTSNLFSLSIDSTKSKYAYAIDNSGGTVFNTTSNNIDLDISFSSAGNPGYIDYVTLNARSNLRLSGSQLIFRDKESNKTGNIALFKLSNITSETVVWDVTNRNEAQNIPVSVNGDFKTSVSQLKEFVAFNPSGTFPMPKQVADIENQNLHSIKSTDYIIVAHKDFHPSAQELADLHFQYDGLSTVIVTPEQIYNEFSYGHQDATAIRSFAKMIYDRNGGIKYLLLFGDGSYDNKVLLPNRKNKYEIVTWQTENSLNDNSSFVSDDFFGFLDDNEGNNNLTAKLDIAIGRFTVNSIEEGATCVAKIRKYIEEQSNGSWRQQITFLADERGDGGFEKQHVEQAEVCSGIIEANHPQFHINKVYMDSYPKVTTSSGKTFPAASDAANQAINEGTLIFNYIGHGSPSSVAHEKIITKTHVNKWKNIKTMAFFLTFTCELSRFDNHNFKSLGEEMFLYPHGGAIAMFTTTRQVGIGSNGDLNKAFHNIIFNDEPESKQAIGDVVMKAKNALSGDNKMRFVFLGDPALKLAYPDIKMNIDKITNARTKEITDTIKALSHIALSGSVKNNSGEIMNDFNGITEIILYDKPLSKQTLGNDDNAKMDYQEFSNIIFTGRAHVENGVFSSEFIVPHDIRYNYDNGKISLYAYSTDVGDRRQAGGANKDIVIGGFDDEAEIDNEGPQITLYLNHQSFKPGDKTGSSPLLFARIEDESGLNIGNGIGHDLILTINGNSNQTFVLNNYFQGDIGNFRAGTVIFQLPALEAGEHEIALKAWDTHNNSSIAKLKFVVGKDKELKINNFILYPIPVQVGGSVYFSFETDEPNSALSLTIEGINLQGAITGIHKKSMVSFRSFVEETQLPLSSIGIRNSGYYFIRFVITTDSGKKGQIVQKIFVRP